MNPAKIDLRVDGMTCGNCARHVREGLAKVPGVTAVEVNLEGHAAQVTHDGTVNAAALVAAVEEAGYEAKAP